MFISGKAGFKGSFVLECDMKRTEMSSEHRNQTFLDTKAKIKIYKHPD